MTDGPGVAGRGVNASGRPTLFWRRGKRHPDSTEPPSGPKHNGQGPDIDRAQALWCAVAQGGQDQEDVPLDGEVAGDERPSDAEFSWGPHDASERIRRKEPQGPNGIVGTDGTSIPEPEPDRCLGVDQRGNHRGEDRGDGLEPRCLGETFNRSTCGLDGSWRCAGNHNNLLDRCSAPMMTSLRRASGLLNGAHPRQMSVLPPRSPGYPQRVRG